MDVEAGLFLYWLELQMMTPKRSGRSVKSRFAIGCEPGQNP